MPHCSFEVRYILARGSGNFLDKAEAAVYELLYDLHVSGTTNQTAPASLHLHVSRDGGPHFTGLLSTRDVRHSTMN